MCEKEKHTFINMYDYYDPSISMLLTLHLSLVLLQRHLISLDVLCSEAVEIQALWSCAAGSINDPQDCENFDERLHDHDNHCKLQNNSLYNR